MKGGGGTVVAYDGGRLRVTSKVKEKVCRSKKKENLGSGREMKP